MINEKLYVVDVEESMKENNLFYKFNLCHINLIQIKKDYQEI